MTAIEVVPKDVRALPLPSPAELEEEESPLTTEEVLALLENCCREFGRSFGTSFGRSFGRDLYKGLVVLYKGLVVLTLAVWA
eukprot:CAMPEP_0202910284 /NCGR_PEP_ID=MMETSP1392-20130828/51616_1 /ASSEMBLY_ACC=CAM_ASM_000868 /TAXON_ID=225041 /ORGANISM="Chlamydomonas chlamydogama, Strain SAG 11-48b" /LENGTH=81 /DNA_ID=CAMNT_0049600347 /DNA_START=24 /DNA_END=265 /DNA_ORIENTATION=+